MLLYNVLSMLTTERHSLSYAVQTEERGCCGWSHHHLLTIQENFPPPRSRSVPPLFRLRAFRVKVCCARTLRYRPPCLLVCLLACSFVCPSNRWRVWFRSKIVLVRNISQRKLFSNTARGWRVHPLRSSRLLWNRRVYWGNAGFIIVWLNSFGLFWYRLCSSSSFLHTSPNY